MNEPMRLQKYMAECGVASRRASETMISEGKVKVNGIVVTELGTKIIPGKDSVEVNGLPIAPEGKKYYIALNKPSGYVTSVTDPYDRPVVTDLVKNDIAARVYPVGRLDYDTEGLLLLTNDGEFANKIMHPKNEIEKTYLAKIKGLLKIAEIRKLEKGVLIDGKITAPAKVKLLKDFEGSSEVEITIREGRNRQVRKMFEAVEHPVIYLKRVSVGAVRLGKLPLGKWRHLTAEERMSLEKN